MNRVTKVTIRVGLVWVAIGSIVSWKWEYYELVVGVLWAGSGSSMSLKDNIKILFGRFSLNWVGKILLKYGLVDFLKIVFDRFY